MLCGLESIFPYAPLSFHWLAHSTDTYGVLETLLCQEFFRPWESKEKLDPYPALNRCHSKVLSYKWNDSCPDCTQNPAVTHLPIPIKPTPLSLAYKPCKVWALPPSKPLCLLQPNGLLSFPWPPLQGQPWVSMVAQHPRGLPLFPSSGPCSESPLTW